MLVPGVSRSDLNRCELSNSRLDELEAFEIGTYRYLKALITEDAMLERMTEVG